MVSGGEEFHPGPETRLDHSELLGNKVLLKHKREKLLTQISEGGRKSALLARVGNGVIYCPISYYDESKECPEVAKILLDPLPQFTFQDNRISQKTLKKEKLSSSRIRNRAV